MRSAVSVILSSPTPDTSMSHPDYEQTAHDHAAILVLVKHIGGQLKPHAFSRVFERVSRQNHVRLPDSTGVNRQVLARYIKEYPVENNDWGDYQTHRRLLGLITVGQFDNQQELNELCRLHESLKVKYSSTLFDSLSIMLGLPIPSDGGPDQAPDYPTPSNFKARALFYPDSKNCPELEAQITDFLSSLFWVLESKRLERSREKVDRVSLLLAPFERKDFVGLDLESRSNRKRCVGRMTKHLGDLCLQAGLANEALGYYVNASDILKTVNDWLWLGGALEGMCAASVVMLYPNLSRIVPLQRNSSLQEGSPGKQRSNSVTASLLPSGEPAERTESPENLLSPDDISKRYREAIIHYSKYQNAGVIETEACFKGAQIAVEQGCALQASIFLQNVLLINLTLSEAEKLQRFISLSEMYAEIGFHRKSAFCQRLAAMRYVSPQNQQPNWTQCYQLMLQALSGHKLSLDPTEYPKDGLQGWPSLQTQLLQELVVAAKRTGHSALATRHMTFLLQTLWSHLSPLEQRDMAVQLQALAAQCEGAPVPLVLESGAVIPPANLTNLPMVRGFRLRDLQPHLRPQRIVKIKEDMGPFLFTPIHFGSLDRKSQGISHKTDYSWVEGDLCEVAIELHNPLPFELKVGNMRLLTTGSVFESVPSSVTLPPNSGPHPLTLSGTAKEIGELEIQGYSTHTLGVKSNCRLKHMTGFPHPHFLIDVIPALPRMQVGTSLPRSHALTSLGDSAHVVTSAGISLYAGESAECTVTLTNESEQPIEMLDISVNSTLDRATQEQVFQWSRDNVQSQLPLQPGAAASFTLYLFAAADFLAGSHASDIDSNSMISGSQPGSFFSGPSSLPSRLSSMSGVDSTGRRNHEMSSSFRGGSNSSTCSLSSGSRFPLTPRPHDSKILEGQLKLRYSGGPGLEAGYCRQCSVAVSVEMRPSVIVTHWDVLPAETGEQFYLVLDIANMTPHELELQYTASKCILIEGEESCRIPVPVDRCSLAKLAPLYAGKPVSADERHQLDAMCSEHIASAVDLRWTTVAGDTSGKVSLEGISLTPDMLDVVRMSPLQWDVTLDGQPVSEELSCEIGQCLRLGVNVRNYLERRLRRVALEVRFYQDHQNGVSNYRLETRLASAGANKVQLPELAALGSVYHECNVVFFTPGLYKVDIQCCSEDSLETSCDILNPLSHSWRFIPPVAISVV